MMLNSVVDPWLRGRDHYFPLLGALKGLYRNSRFLRFMFPLLLLDLFAPAAAIITKAADPEMCRHFSSVVEFLLLD